MDTSWFVFFGAIASAVLVSAGATAIVMFAVVGVRQVRKESESFNKLFERRGEKTNER